MKTLRIFLIAICLSLILCAGFAWGQGMMDGISCASPTDPHWPVPGVTKPWHLYDFTTGTYNDYGSIGGLTLTPEGTGNTFLSGLVLTGTGYAQYSTTSADLSDLGSVYSIIMEFNPTSLLGITGIAQGGTAGTDGWGFFAYSGPNPYYNINSSVWFNSSTVLTVSTNYQVIISSSGTGANQLNVYINGSLDKAYTGPAMITGTGPFQVGSFNGHNLTGTIKKVGVLKGTAWTQANVTAIYTDYAMRQVHRYIEIAKAPFMGLIK